MIIKMFDRNCQQVTALVLAGEDRKLALGERLLVRLHLRVCGACPEFNRQVQFMRVAFGRWRGYHDSDEG